MMSWDTIDKPVGHLSTLIPQMGEQWFSVVEVLEKPYQVKNAKVSIGFISFSNIPIAVTSTVIAILWYQNISTPKGVLHPLWLGVS